MKTFHKCAIRRVKSPLPNQFECFNLELNKVVAEPKEMALTPIGENPYLTGSNGREAFGVTGYRTLTKSELEKICDLEQPCEVEMNADTEEPIILVGKIILHL